MNKQHKEKQSNATQSNATQSNATQGNEKKQTGKRRIYQKGMAALAAVMLFFYQSPFAWAGGFGEADVSIDPSKDPVRTIGGIAKLLLTLVQIGGVILLIYSVVQFVSSLQAHDSSQRINGILMIVSALLMISLQYILQGFGVVIS